jgi:ribosomal protein S18 acetylase RimI-like enzyme
MSREIQFSENKASAEDILAHLQKCDDSFIPALSERVDLVSFASKIKSKAVTFEAWNEGKLMALIAAYYNDEINLRAFITSVSVDPEFLGLGIASQLMDACIAYGISNRFNLLTLQVSKFNDKAIKLYEKFGFQLVAEIENEFTMELILKNEQ